MIWKNIHHFEDPQIYIDYICILCDLFAGAIGGERKNCESFKNLSSAVSASDIRLSLVNDLRLCPREENHECKRRWA